VLCPEVTSRKNGTDTLKDWTELHGIKSRKIALFTVSDV
jgi:hypothetical protein